MKTLTPAVTANAARQLETTKNVNRATEACEAGEELLLGCHSTPSSRSVMAGKGNSGTSRTAIVEGDAGSSTGSVGDSSVSSSSTPCCFHSALRAVSDSSVAVAGGSGDSVSSAANGSSSSLAPSVAATVLVEASNDSHCRICFLFTSAKSTNCTPAILSNSRSHTTSPAASNDSPRTLASCGMGMQPMTWNVKLTRSCKAGGLENSKAIPPSLMLVSLPQLSSPKYT